MTFPRTKALTTAVCAALLATAGCRDSGVDVRQSDATGSRSEQAATGPLPGDSVWQLDSTWEDRRGTEVRLADFRGHTTVLAMMFTNCQYACPQIVADMRALQEQVAAEGGTVPQFVLVSMDHERDHPPALRKFANQHELEAEHWTLLHGDADAVRELGAVLGVSFRRGADGNYAHSNQIAVLDSEGRIVHRQQGLQADDTQTVRTLLRLLDL